MKIAFEATDNYLVASLSGPGEYLFTDREKRMARVALRGWGIEANTEEQVRCVKTKLAQRMSHTACSVERLE
jgi:hypothetical protein